jgi:uncharacterized protein YigE (DUF2233 family)
MGACIRALTAAARRSKRAMASAYARMARFAISQGGVVRRLARLFRDGLNCPNALFLDGGSSLYAPSLTSFGNIVSLGPILAIFRK